MWPLIVSRSPLTTMSISFSLMPGRSATEQETTVGLLDLKSGLKRADSSSPVKNGATWRKGSQRVPRGSLQRESADARRRLCEQAVWP